MLWRCALTPREQSAVLQGHGTKEVGGTLSTIPRWLETLFVAGATAGLMQQGLLGTNAYIRVL